MSDERNRVVAEGDALRTVTLTLCGRCLAGGAGECHTPGCALWMNRAPDIPVATHEMCVRCGGYVKGPDVLCGSCELGAFGEHG